MGELAKSQSVRAQLHRLETAEIWLIRTGQHLFKEWRDKGRCDNVLEESFEKVWELKREIRLAKRDLSVGRRRGRLAEPGGHRGQH